MFRVGDKDYLKKRVGDKMIVGDGKKKKDCFS